jgi:hypothetical protein
MSNNEGKSKEELNIISSFNKTVKEFTDDVAQSFPEFKEKLSRLYHAVEEHDEKYILFFEKSIEDHFMAITTKDETLFLQKSLEILPNIDIHEMWALEPSITTKNTIWKYLHLMLLLVSNYRMKTTSIEEMMKEWNRVLESSNEMEEEDLARMNEQAESIVRLIESLGASMSENDDDDDDDEDDDSAGDKNETPENFAETMKDDPFVKKLESSKIAKLAEELASEISEGFDFSEDTPTSVQDILGMLGKDPNKMVNLVKSVGDKIQTKLQNGEFREKEIIDEAQNLMSSMKDSKAFRKMFKKANKNGKGLDPTSLFNMFMNQSGNNDKGSGFEGFDPSTFESLMKNMKDVMPNMMNPGGTTTQDRLRRKLAERQDAKMAEEVKESASKRRRKKKKKKRNRLNEHNVEPVAEMS